MNNSISILLVDDDPDEREMFLFSVRSIKPSIRCTYAENGVKALEILRSEGDLPDFIFLDVNIPMSNAGEFISRLKLNPRCAHIPVIVYTGYNITEDIAEIPADYFLTKPLTMDELREAIILVLQKFGITASHEQ